MYAIRLQWREFSVALDYVDQWMKSNIADYAGNSADADLKLWFTSEPDELTKDLILDYWQSLTPGSTESVKYVTAEQITQATEALKTSLLTKNWDDMAPAERKCALGLPLTRTDLGL